MLVGKAENESLVEVLTSFLTFCFKIKYSVQNILCWKMSIRKDKLQLA